MSKVDEIRCDGCGKQVHRESVHGWAHVAVRFSSSAGDAITDWCPACQPKLAMVLRPNETKP